LAGVYESFHVVDAVWRGKQSCFVIEERRILDVEWMESSAAWRGDCFVELPQ
jgi:hypothetical protein